MDTVHSLSSLPATDGNFISVLNRATDEEISQEIDVMENSSGQHKGRITACQRELRKRMKVRNKQWTKKTKSKLKECIMYRGYSNE